MWICRTHVEFIKPIVQDGRQAKPCFFAARFLQDGCEAEGSLASHRLGRLEFRVCGLGLGLIAQSLGFPSIHTHGALEPQAKAHKAPNPQTLNQNIAEP